MRTLETAMTERLSAPLVIVRSDTSFARTELNPAESRHLAEFRHEKRRLDWLRGRNALKQLLVTLNCNDDTTALRFPNRRVSLTHAGGFAYAVGTSESYVGIGLDYEPLRNINTRVARWFLDEKELAWLMSQPQQVHGEEIIRLWTIKEAAFKAHPDNSGLVLTKLAIADPSAARITVNVAEFTSPIRVTCRPFDAGYLSVATLRENEND
jgi:4'-phosphopantetheinyl transferase EntD